MTFRRCALIVLAPALLALSAMTSALAVEFPESAAGKQMQELLAALNSGEPSSWEAYVLQDQKARDSAEVKERRLGFFAMMWENHGGFEPHSVLQSTEYRIEILVKSRDSLAAYEWLTLSVQLDTLPPHGLAGIGAGVADDPNETLPTGPITKEELVRLVDEFVDQQIARDRFSGSVMIAKDDVPIYSRVEGEACKRYNVPNKIDTKFCLGSMNKMFSGVAITQLAQQGKLAFTDYVGKYLPDYPNQAVREKVTIHHLLTHTSGTGDYWEELFDTHFWEVRTVQRLAELTATKPLEFEPGAQFRYSNAGPVILGLIIEKLSGLTYDEYIRRFVTGPAGMTATDCYEIDREVPNLAIGYAQMDVMGNRTDDWRANYFLHAAKGGPAGGGYSTVDDLVRFAAALQNGVLLSPAYVDTLTTGKVEMGPQMKYAYLFGESNANGHRVIGHSGGAPGINAVLRIYTDLGYTVAVLSNYSNGAEPIADRIEKLLTL